MTSTRYRTVIKALALFAVSMALTAGLTAPRDSEAAWRRQQAVAHCRVLTTGNTTFDDMELYNNNGINFLQVLCPISETSHFLKRDIATVTLHVSDYHASYAASARACVAYRSDVGGTCGEASYSSGSSGPTSFGVADLSYWSSTYNNDFGYLLIEIPPKNAGGTMSGLRGYYSST